MLHYATHWYFSLFICNVTSSINRGILYAKRYIIALSFSSLCSSVLSESYHLTVLLVLMFFLKDRFSVIIFH